MIPCFLPLMCVSEPSIRGVIETHTPFIDHSRENAECMQFIKDQVFSTQCSCAARKGSNQEGCQGMCSMQGLEAMPSWTRASAVKVCPLCGS